MSRKKRFGISEALTRGLSETIHVVENNNGMFRNVILPLSRIELDPENPRKLVINIADVKSGIDATDPLFAQKQLELEKLKELAHTIKSSGVINPIVVYKRGDVYRVVAGERRCLASLLAKKNEIEARVFNEKPKGFELKLIQWIENTAREDLTLAERLDNVRDILSEYHLQHGDSETTATLLKNITGLSLSQSSYYLTAIDAPADVQELIKNGSIKNLDKAALLASIASIESRQQAIEACLNGASIKELRSVIGSSKKVKAKAPILLPVTRGRKSLKINMGSTINSAVVEAIVHSVIAQKKYARHYSLFSEVNWKDLRQASSAFRKLVEILEKEIN